MEMDKKGNAVIEFIARNPEDRYEYRVKVFPNGSASIDVNMQNRQSISFRGAVYKGRKVRNKKQVRRTD